MTNFRIILILLYGIAFWQIAATTHTNVHANVEHRIFEPGKLQIIVTRRSSDYHAILIQRATPQKHIDIITVYGKEKVIPNESKAQFFDGHLKGCFQCKAIVVWFADVDIIYGIFNFIHDKLYVEPTSIYDNQYKFNRVPQTPKLPSSLRGLKPFNKTLCPMSMYVDNELNQKFHYDFLAVYRYIMVTVEFVNDIYKSIDFGRTKNGERITGVHFGVVRLTIEKYEYDYGDNEGYVNVNRLLYSFAKVVTSSDVCITVIITGREPLGPNIGAAFGGKIKNSKVYGICGVRQLYDTYTNVAAISTVFNDTVVRVFDLHRTLGHEIGHLASALHDDENLDFATLMAPHVTNGDNESHFTFLDQTIKRMGELLSVVYELCFLWPGHVTECGNGILELGEQCDPGSNEGDNCCLKTCVFQSYAQCSPKHHDCCLEDCRFAPSTTTCPIQPNDKEITSFCTGISASCDITIVDADYNVIIFMVIFVVLNICLVAGIIWLFLWMRRTTRLRVNAGAVLYKPLKKDESAKSMSTTASMVTII